MYELIEFIEKYPDKDFIMDLPQGLALDYREMDMCAKQLKNG